MTIAVTGATGPFGRHAVQSLLRRGVPAREIIAVGRNPSQITDLARHGVTVRPADYNDPPSVQAAFTGADRLLFVSGSELGQRIAQHQAVVTAAAEAGIGLIAYTSAAKADTSDMILVQEHRATEQAITSSGLPYVFLRNGWYLENYTAMLPTILTHGLLGAAGDGRISGATRADLAEAAAAVIAGTGRRKPVYELGGPSFTLTELAAEISRASGREVRYTNLTEGAYATALTAAGVPQTMAAALADTHRAASRGGLYIESDDLTRLLGRPATSLAEAIKAALPAVPLALHQTGDPRLAVDLADCNRPPTRADPRPSSRRRGTRGHFVQLMPDREIPCLLERQETAVLRLPPGRQEREHTGSGRRPDAAAPRPLPAPRRTRAPGAPVVPAHCAKRRVPLRSPAARPPVLSRSPADAIGDHLRGCPGRPRCSWRCSPS